MKKRVSAWIIVIAMLLAAIPNNSLGVSSIAYAAETGSEMEETITEAAEIETAKVEAQDISETEGMTDAESERMTETKDSIAEETETVAETKAAAMPAKSSRAGGNDRTNAFKLNSMTVTFMDQVVYTYDGVTGTVSHVDIDSSAVAKIGFDLAWTQKNMSQADFQPGDYIVFDICTVSGSDSAIWQNVSANKILYDGETPLAVASVVATPNDNGTLKLSYKITFLDDIVNKNNITGNLTGSAVVKPAEGEHIKIEKDGEVMADLTVVPKPGTGGKPEVVQPTTPPESKKGLSNYNESENAINWQIRIAEYYQKQFSDYKNGTTSDYAHLVVEEILDMHQTFTDPSATVYQNGVSITVEVPIYLYDKSDLNQAYLYGKGTFYLGNTALLTFVDPTTAGAEAYVKSNARTWTVLTETDPDNAGATRERLVINFGGPENGGIRFNEVTEVGSAPAVIASLQDSYNAITTLVNANSGAADSTVVAGADGVSHTLGEWRKMQTIYADTITYYATNPFVHCVNMSVKTMVKTGQTATDQVSSVKNKYTANGGFTEKNGEAGCQNFWSGTMTAKAAKGDVQIFKADSLYGNTAGNKTDDSAVSGFMGEVAFEVYRGDATGPLKFEEVDGKFKYTATGSLSTVVTNTANGSAIVTGLAPGSYYFKEVAAPGGYYTGQNQKIDFTVAADRVEYKLANNDARGVKFMKVDAADSAALPDATFKLYQYTQGDYSDAVQVTGFTKKTINGTTYYVYDGSGAEELITGADGTINISQLAAGKYYVVESSAPNGYDLVDTKHPFELTSAVTGDTVVDLGTITNEKIVLVNKTVTKVWNDGNNQDGKRPASISVQLYANGVASGAAVTLNGTNSWSYTWTNLPSKVNGTAIVYTMREVQVPAGYQVNHNDTTNTITNSYTPEVVTISGTKTWADANNQDGKRPASITVELYDGETLVDSKVVTENDGWAYTFANMPKYAAGREIQYTVKEQTVTGYQTTYNGYDITNTYVPEAVEVSGTKTWADANNQDGKRPDAITVELWADGILTDSKEVTASDNWAYSFTNLPKYAEGTEIDYVVVELPVAEYTTTYDGYNITNTYIPEEVEVSGTKTWEDADNQDGKRPGEITVELYADGVLTDSKTVTEGDNWTYSFTNLPKYAVGVEIQYTVAELPVAEYTTAYDGYNITNAYVPEEVEVSGTKTWDDADNQDGKRPDEITVELYADGVLIDSKAVTETDNWTYNFVDLPKYAAGVEIQYSVKEVEVAEYQTVYDGYNITNQYTPGLTSKTAEKVWDDKDNQDGKRPDSVTVELYADGVASGKTAELKAENDWRYTWTDLPEKQRGVDVVYTVAEVNVPEGYTVSYSDDTAFITNHYTPEEVEVSGTKTWVDDDDKAKKRPKSIVVNLLADGVEIDKKMVTAEENWAYSFTNLPKYKAGTEIVYTITEDAVTDYKTTIDGFNITNTYTKKDEPVEDETKKPDPNVKGRTITKTGTTTVTRSVKTGDNSRIEWFLLIAVLSAAVAGISYSVNRRKRLTK